MLEYEKETFHKAKESKAIDEPSGLPRVRGAESEGRRLDLQVVFPSKVELRRKNN